MSSQTEAATATAPYDDFSSDDGRHVTDQEFAAAWAEKNNRYVIKRVLRNFSRQLDPDELESVGMEALWKALRKHDFAHPSGQKFTTTLYRYTQWACLNAVQGLERREFRDEKTVDGVAGKLACLEQESLDRVVVNRELVESALASIPDGYASLLRTVYLDHKPLDEVAAAEGRSVESVKRTVRTAIEACRFASSR